MLKKQSPEKQSTGFTPKTDANVPLIHTNTLSIAKPHPHDYNQPIPLDTQ